MTRTIRTILALALLTACTACTSPTAPTPRVLAPEAAQRVAEPELLAQCLAQAWQRSGPHLTPESLARYVHLANFCYARWM